MEKGKVVVFIGVAALHVAAVAALKHSVRQPAHRSNSVYAVWVVGDPAVKEPVESKPAARRNVQAAGMSEEKNVPAAQPQISTAPISLPNWEAAGNDAVTATIARQLREDARRDLYPAPDKTLPSDQPPALFKAPLYNDGHSQQFDDGEIDTWIGPECYASNRSQSVLSAGRNQLNVVCKGNAGKRKANDKLFDHLRPDYLREDAQVVAP